MPAAAVKREGQTLFGLIWRKEYVDGRFNFNLKLVVYLLNNYYISFLEFKRGSQNFKCNSKMFWYLKESHKAKAVIYFKTDVEIWKYGKQKGLDTPVVHTLTYECKFWIKI